MTFLKAAFEAAGDVVPGLPVALKIADAFLLVSDGGGVGPATATFIHLYVPDADVVYARAIKAGAQSIEAPADMPWGDRRGTVEDRWGNTWQVATYRGQRGSKTAEPR